MKLLIVAFVLFQQALCAQALDSLQMLNVLRQALDTAKIVGFERPFERQYALAEAELQVSLVFGPLLHRQEQHLLVRRGHFEATYLDLYRVEEQGRLRLLLSRVQDARSYVRDTFQDVNGDGQRDFLVEWFPSCGCCRREIYGVYLYQAHKQSFAPEQELVNPVFFPKKGLVQCLEYGHPGQVGFYTLRWRGEKLDTLEFIYRDLAREGFVRLPRSMKEGPIPEDWPLLKQLPKAYRRNKHLGYFMED